MVEKKEMAIEELELNIRTLENDLQKLRKQFLRKTGRFPATSYKDPSWRWTVFITLGFAFISSMVFLLGIRKSGSDANKGIPAFFFQTDMSYFAILTMYVVVMVLVVQSDKISGYQALVILLGFWCSHWLIYDWTWHAINIGMGQTELAGFWESLFYAPLVMPRPPMWMFLTWAIIGGIIALYTFTVPKNGKELIPPALWLYTAYANATICEIIGLERGVILIIGIILIIITFICMGFFTISRLRSELTTLVRVREDFKSKFKKENLKLDPLSIPWVFIFVGMLITMYLFLVLIPVIGLFFGIIPWFIMPFYFILFRSSSAVKYSKRIQVLIGLVLLIVVIGILLFMNYYSL